MDELLNLVVRLYGWANLTSLILFVSLIFFATYWFLIEAFQTSMTDSWIYFTHNCSDLMIKLLWNLSDAATFKTTGPPVPTFELFRFMVIMAYAKGANMLLMQKLRKQIFLDDWTDLNSCLLFYTLMCKKYYNLCLNYLFIFCIKKKTLQASQLKQQNNCNGRTGNIVG